MNLRKQPAVPDLDAANGRRIHLDPAAHRMPACPLTSPSRGGALGSLFLPGLLASAFTSQPMLALQQPDATDSFESIHRAEFTLHTAPTDHEGTLRGHVWAAARVGLLCAGIEARSIHSVVGNGALAAQSASKVKGQNQGAAANARSEGSYTFTSPNTYEVEVKASGDSRAEADRCVGNRKRAATAGANARAKFKVTSEFPGLTTTGPIVASYGFTAAWVNENDLGGSLAISRVQLIEDPVIVSLYDDSTNDLLGVWETMRVDSKVRGSGATEMFLQPGPFNALEQWIRNDARDMELRIEVGSAIVDPSDHGLLDILVENGIVTRRIATGRFASVLGVPALGTPGDSWSARIDTRAIDLALPYPGTMPTRIEVELSGAAQGAPEGGAVDGWCDLTSELGRGHGGADVSVVAPGDSALGFSALHGQSSLIAVKRTAGPTDLSHLVVPFIVPGAPLSPAPGSADPFTPDAPLAPAAVFVRLSDGDPALGGAVLYGDLGTPQTFEVEATNVYRVAPGNLLDPTHVIGHVVVDLSAVDDVPSDTDIWIEVTMIPPAAFPAIIVPPSPYADASSDLAYVRDTSLPNVSATELREPTSNRPICLPFQLFGVEAPRAYTYCNSIPNSTGAVGRVGAFGTSRVAANDLTLEALHLPPNVIGFFLTARTQGNTPIAAGTLCLSGPIGRYVGPGQILFSGAAGSVSLPIDLLQMPLPTGMLPAQVGEVWNFQFWHRDSFSGAAQSRLTSALSIQFE